VNALRTLALALTLALGLAVSGQAQPAATPPAGLSQEQFNSLVDAISNSVFEKLKAEGAHAPAPAAAPAESKAKGKAPPPPKIVRVEPKTGPDPFAALIDGTVKVVHALPSLGAELARIPSLLDQQTAGGRGASTFLLLLCAVGVVAVAAEAAAVALAALPMVDLVTIDGDEQPLDLIRTLRPDMLLHRPGDTGPIGEMLQEWGGELRLMDAAE